MASDLIVAQHDTWPPVRGAASDEDGLMDLTTADWLKFIMKQGVITVSGTATVIDPPDADGFNWQYTWAATDTAQTGDYSAELEIHWDDGAVPPQIETVPNEGPLTITIRADFG